MSLVCMAVLDTLAANSDGNHDSDMATTTQLAVSIGFVRL